MLINYVTDAKNMILYLYALRIERVWLFIGLEVIGLATQGSPLTANVRLSDQRGQTVNLIVTTEL